MINCLYAMQIPVQSAVYYMFPFSQLADSELDQASSGFEDCHFLLQQKTSADSTHTTAAPSINESLRVHKPQSLPDSLGLLFTKQLSEGGSAKTIKAPSISSNGSNKSGKLIMYYYLHMNVQLVDNVLWLAHECLVSW